jgi:hypothetical protein
VHRNITNSSSLIKATCLEKNAEHFFILQIELFKLMEGYSNYIKGCKYHPPDMTMTAASLPIHFRRMKT